MVREPFGPCVSSYRKIRPLQSAYSYKNNLESPELPPVLDHRRRLLKQVLAWVACVLVTWQAAAAPFSSDAVKAAYLFRFASYVDWPSSMKGEGPFVIGVIGAEDVAVHLEHLLTGMTVQGRSAKVRRVRTPGDVAGVHILYVGQSVFRSARALRLHALDQPILLVTDAEKGLQGGGVINFVEVNRNLRFEISLDAADRSGLKIDSALLAVAARVEPRSTK